MNRGLAIAGAAVLGGAWAISALAAGTVLSVDDHGSGGFAPLFLPVAGPFITLGTADSVSFSDNDERAGAIFLLFDGVTQLTGAVLLIGGIASDKEYWLRSDIPQQKAAAPPRPEILVGPGGGAVRMRF
jgi:hypothetical protein